MPGIYLCFSLLTKQYARDIMMTRQQFGEAKVERSIMNITAEERFFRFSIAMETISKKLQKYKNERMSHYGLHSMHVMFLCALDKTEDGMTAGELARSCGVDKAFISRTATDLRKRGFVDFSCVGEGAEKQYKKRMILTDAGKAIMKEISEIVKDTVERATLGIDMEQFEVFYQVMEKLSGNLTVISDC